MIGLGPTTVEHYLCHLNLAMTHQIQLIAYNPIALCCNLMVVETLRKGGLDSKGQIHREGSKWEGKHDLVMGIM